MKRLGLAAGPFEPLEQGVLVRQELRSRLRTVATPGEGIVAHRLEAALGDDPGHFFGDASVFPLLYGKVFLDVFRRDAMRRVQGLVRPVGWHELGPFGNWQAGHTAAVRDVGHIAGGCHRDVPLGGAWIGNGARGVAGLESLHAVQDLDVVMPAGEYECVGGVEKRQPAVTGSHGRTHRRRGMNQAGHFGLAIALDEAG